MRWILSNIPLLIFGFVIFTMIRAVLRAGELSRKKQQQPGSETEEQHRVREIQERIRRIAAERRGQANPTGAAPPLLSPSVPSEAPRPATLPPIDPFGGGGGRMGRMLRELERRAQSPAPRQAAAPAHLTTYEAAEMERQQQYADRMRALEEERALAQRRAAQLAAARSEELNTAVRRRAAAREDLLVNIRDPEALRRAILLKEVLGTPVGLR